MLLAALVAAATAVIPAQASAAAEAADAATRIEMLAAQRWQQELERDIDLRQRVGLPITAIQDDDAETRERVGNEAAQMLAVLNEIPVAELDEDWRAMRDILVHKTSLDAEAAAYQWLEFTIVPYALYRKLEAVHAQLARAPLTTTADRAAYLALVTDYADLFVEQRRRLDAQAERGIRLPAAAIPGASRMLEGLAASIEERLVPSADRLGLVSPDIARSFRAEAEKAVSTRARPALDALLADLKGRHHDAAPPEPGLSHYPGGRDAYRHLVRKATSLPLDPDSIHVLGLQRVSELKADIQLSARALGLSGTLAEIYGALRRDSRFIAKTPEETRARYEAYLAEIEPLVPSYFARRPAAPGVVRRLPPELEGSLTFGFYQPPTSADPSGAYYFNGTNIEDRNLLTAQTIIYHELVPGHHFQVATQLERLDLPPIRRHFVDTAFVEGWAEYAAGLGTEMGLYNDPHRRIGRRVMEMFFAVRLVVDTGLGDRKWTLAQAQRYMAEHTFLSPTEIETEVIRYATRPGQALAYRIGHERFMALRQKAQDALGSAFDIRHFHQMILDGGTLPLASLEGRVDRWISEAARPSAPAPDDPK